MIASDPPDAVREFVLLRRSMAGTFRSFTSIGPADHGKEVSLAGALRLDEIAVYGKQATGEKYLINPNKGLAHQP